MVPILGSILTGIAINVGARLAATVAKGVVEAVASRSRPSAPAASAFKDVLAERMTDPAGAPAATPPRPSRSTAQAGSGPDLPPGEVISRVASGAQMYPIALDLASGKGLPSPRRAAAAYRGVHPALT
jgi:hypothetical protein